VSLSLELVNEDELTKKQEREREREREIQAGRRIIKRGMAFSNTAKQRRLNKLHLLALTPELN